MINSNDKFQKACKLGLTFQLPTPQSGRINVVDLYKLSLDKLDLIAQAINQQLKDADTVSFVDPEKNAAADPYLALRFEIVFEIIRDKKEDRDRAARAAQTRAQNQRILELIAQKQDEKLTGLSVEELQKMLQPVDDII